MRITFLCPAAVDMSGGARVNHIYASLLQQRGHQVTVVARPPRPQTLRQRLRAIYRKPPGSQTSATHYRGDAYTFKVLKKFRPAVTADVPDGDVVIATWWETAEWMGRLPATKGRHAHFIQGYEAYDYMPKDRVDAVLATPTYKITISNWLDKLLKEQFGNKHVAKVPNSVDTKQFHAPRRGRQPVPTIGMLYSKVTWKDCPTGFSAFRLLQEKWPDARLVTFGSIAPLAEMPLPQGATHTRLPDQDKIRDIYAQCDVWFCPSTHEGFHLPPLEAMACRCPVISTPVGGPIDTIVDGENGFFVPMGDAVQMAKSLERFFLMPEEQWQAMSDAAYATATGYTWDDAATRFEQALEEAVAKT